MLHKPFVVFSLIYLFWLGWAHWAQAQSVEITGTVIDAENQEKLPFVNVSVRQSDGKSLQIGTSTDIDGKFSLKIPTDLLGENRRIALKFSYVGYAPLVREVGPGAWLEISLKKASQELREVVFLAGENPAHPIVRRAVANRRRNDPEQQTSFRYQAYNKLVFTTDRSALVQDLSRKSTLIDSLTADLKAAEDKAKSRRAKLAKDTTKLKVDSTDYEADAFFAQRHLFMSETVTEHRYLRPGKSKETVLASRTSGFKSAVFNLVTTNLQPLTFYKEYLSIFNNDYLNPLADNPFARYEFFLEDSLLTSRDTTYIISFRPKPKTTFRGLKGLVSINTQGYAISNVIAETYDSTALITLRFEQKYRLVGEKYWFPEQLNSLMQFRKVDLGKHRVVGYGRSYLTDVQINEGVAARDFDHISVEAVAEATQRDSLYWAKFRPDPLAKVEQNTYQFMDSLGQKMKFDKFANILRYVATDRIPIGSFNLRLSQLTDFNNYEGFRLGLPLETGDKISKVVVLGGYAAYGFRDQAWKYGGHLQLDFNRRRGFFAKFSYLQDVSEPALPGLANPGSGRGAAQGLRRVFGFLMDSVQEVKAEIGFRPTRKNLQVRLSFGQQRRKPTYDYQFVPLGDLADPTFRFTEAAAELVYTARERNTLVAGHTVFAGGGRPLIRLRFAQGFAGILDGQFAYQKIDFSVEHLLRSKWLGRTQIQLQGGYVNGDVPLSRLYFVPGGTAGNSNFIINQAFQTAGIYEFAASQYAALFVAHNFGILYKGSRYSRPELLLAQHVGYGALRNPDSHQGLALRSMDQGLFESGLIIKNLARIEYNKTLYLGFGGGVFGRYGAYRREKSIDNLTARLVVSVDF